MQCFSGFELYSRWVPLTSGLESCDILEKNNVSLLSKFEMHFNNFFFFLRSNLSTDEIISA